MGRPAPIFCERCGDEIFDSSKARRFCRNCGHDRKRVREITRGKASYRANRDPLEVHRRISFRGRTNLGYAHWKYKGIKNVITLYLNKLTEHTLDLHGGSHPPHTKMFEQLFIYYFTLVDFHEWLHLFIRRESGLKNTYFVTDEVHDWMGSVENKIINVWYETIVEPEHLETLKPCDIPLVSILERDISIEG